MTERDAEIKRQPLTPDQLSRCASKLFEQAGFSFRRPIVEGNKGFSAGGVESTLLAIDGAVDDSMACTVAAIAFLIAAGEMTPAIKLPSGEVIDLSQLVKDIEPKGQERLKAVYHGDAC